MQASEMIPHNKSGETQVADSVVTYINIKRGDWVTAIVSLQ